MDIRHEICEVDDHRPRQNWLVLPKNSHYCINTCKNIFDYICYCGVYETKIIICFTASLDARSTC